MNPLLLVVTACGLLQGQALDVMLVLDHSTGTEQATDRIRAKAFGEDMRVGIVSALVPSQLIEPLTADKKRLDAGLRRLGARAGVRSGGVLVTQNWTLDLAGALSKALAEFTEAGESNRPRAIVVLFAGEDRGLINAAERLRSRLQDSGARLFAIAVMRQDPVREMRGDRRMDFPFPVGTAQILGDLAEMSRGRLYKQGWDIGDILKEAVKP